MVINLAAGLDSRPYRMQLPASLRWVEVDLPDMLNYKQVVLANESPLCVVERVPWTLKRRRLKSDDSHLICEESPVLPFRQ